MLKFASQCMGEKFSMPATASFGRSQVWSDHTLPIPIRLANAFDMRVPLEALLLALAIGGVDSGSQRLDDCGPAATTARRPSPGRQTRTFGATGAGHAAERGRALGGIPAELPEKDADAERQHPGRDGPAATFGAAPRPEPVPGTAAIATGVGRNAKLVGRSSRSPRSLRIA